MLAYYIAGAILIYVLTLLYFFAPSPFVPGSKFAKKHQSIAVLVLGDIGRSPRMQYHALSLSRLGYKVDLIGYGNTKPHEALLTDENIRYQFLPDVPESLSKGPRYLFPILGPIKVLHQLLFLVLILGYAIDPPAYLLVQNPPAIPVLALAQLLCWLRNTRLVIDWHNLGYTILGLRLGEHHPLVKIARRYEQFFGRTAYAHLMVTDAMRSWLSDTFNLKGKQCTLHDRPAGQFKALSKAEQTAFLNAFEHTRDGQFSRERGDRLLVSSTSWTPDEDFGILLSALKRYDEAPVKSNNKAHLLVIITGKGALQAAYTKKIEEMALHSVTIKTAWLQAADYPKLLACADLGISLHTSSSGLDLPMKIVDLFGCGTPVLAIDFEALPELVTQGVDGRIVADDEDMAACLLGLFADSSAQGESDEEYEGVDDVGSAHLQTLKRGAKKQSALTWDIHWAEVAAPLFEHRS
ncbi:putative beta-1,4-mannosyltransferase [Protomyces lactucae-debilis]|uniref:Chitobiosyldiphosphodolichol beta-mannosyltransferase n=1 Tax=Protomyces lactucae-debilis TaxID=2754530 RepID=A0A1Y2FNC3_PROLT|nr:putative beta-1,4-mannosyltransferase [Protomyces lactucae-debilis]ORY85491.1 putative beta-1,4-mannosyltransferase [Protomyces lactucae-debilis]